MISIKRAIILLVVCCGLLRAVAASTPTLPRSIKAFRIQPAQPRHQQTTLSAANDVLSVAKRNSASKFVELALQTSWLSWTLVNTTGYTTVFAFSDDAYARSSAAVKAALADRWKREAIMQYHAALGSHLISKTTHGLNTTLYSFFPSPPLSSSTPYQPIYVDTYWVYAPASSKSVVTASGAPVIKLDLAASNGVVHIIDKVMYPVPTGADLAKYLQEEPKYSMLYAALQKVNLTSALSTPAFKPLTLLAPSNAAFSKLTAAQSKLLENTTILARVLTFHVVAWSYYGAAFYENLQLHSLEGSTIYFEVGAGGVSAEGSMLVNFDTTVTNGVVHELDRVMFPRLLNKLLVNED